MEDLVSDKKVRSVIVLMIGILIVFTFYPLINVGFTTNDDMVLELSSSKHTGITGEINIAKDQGRFFMPVAYQFAKVPYLVRNFVYYKFVSIGIIIVNIILFGYMIYIFYRSLHYAVLLVIIYLVGLQNMWDHYLLTSYPFVFHAGICILMISLIFYKQYIDTNRSSRLIISTVLFFLTLLLYEVFAMYFVLFIFVSFFYRSDPDHHAQEPFSKAFLRIIPHASVLFIYAAIYSTFRHYYPSHYEGNVISHFSFISFVKVMYQYSVSSLPTYIYRHFTPMFNDYSVAFEGHRSGIIQIVKNARVEWIAKALISSYFVYHLIHHISTNFSKRTFWLTVLLSLTLIIAPIFLIALTTKYQLWVVSAGSLAHTVTFFSYFGAVLFFTIMIIFMRRLFSSHKLLLLMYSLFIGLIIAITSFVVDYSNYHVTLSQTQSHLKWKTIDQLIKTDEFISIPENSVIYAPSLYGHINIAATFAPYWSDYIKLKTGKNITILSTKEELAGLNLHSADESNIYFLKYNQEFKNPNQFIVLAKIAKIDLVFGEPIIYSKNANLYTYSNYKKFLLLLNMGEGPFRKKLNIDENTLNPTSDFIAYLIDKSDDRGPLTKTMIHSSQNDIDVENILISYFTDYNFRDNDYVRILWQKDFSGLEGDTGNNWRWCGKNGVLIIRNTSNQDFQVRLHMMIATGYEQMSILKIWSRQFHDELHVNRRGTSYEKNIILHKKSEYAINFFSDANKIESTADSRYLVFRVINFKFEL